MFLLTESQDKARDLTQKQVESLAKLHHLSELMQEEKSNLHRVISDSTKLKDFHSLGIPHSGKKALTVLLKEGALNQRTLAQMLSISPQAVSELVKKLEANGFVTKTNGKQKNENMISLTPLGKEISDMLKEIITNHAKQVFTEFTEEEVLLFGQFLDKLLLQQKKMQENL